MTAFNLDNGIVFVILPLPFLRLLVLISNIDMGDVNGLKDANIMLDWQGGKMLNHLGRKIQSSGHSPCPFFLAFSPSHDGDFLAAIVLTPQCLRCRWFLSQQINTYFQERKY